MYFKNLFGGVFKDTTASECMCMENENQQINNQQNKKVVKQIEYTDKEIFQIVLAPMR